MSDDQAQKKEPSIRTVDIILANQLVLSSLLALLSTNKKFPAERFVEIMSGVQESVRKRLKPNEAKTVEEMIGQILAPMQAVINDRSDGEDGNGSSEN